MNGHDKIIAALRNAFPFRSAQGFLLYENGPMGISMAESHSNNPPLIQVSVLDPYADSVEPIFIIALNVSLHDDGLTFEFPCRDGLLSPEIHLRLLSRDRFIEGLREWAHAPISFLNWYSQQLELWSHSMRVMSEKKSWFFKRREAWKQPPLMNYLGALVMFHLGKINEALFFAKQYSASLTAYDVEQKKSSDQLIAELLRRK
jgi:hypothetical protein